MTCKTVFNVLLMLFSTSAAINYKVIAQEIPRADVSPNYSFISADLGSGGMSSLHGYTFALNRNLTPWLAIAADYAMYFGTAPVPFCFFGTSPCEVWNQPSESARLTPILFGVRFQSGRNRFMPFARALFGFSVLRSCPPPGCDTKTGFTQDFGGGMQFRITEKRLGWRVEADFFQTHLFGGAQNDFRFSTGPVIFFYKRQ